MTTKLNNPLFENKSKNMVLASVFSPVSKQEMVLCKIKSSTGNEIPVYVCLEDRVCLPVKKENSL